jgi:ABC-type Zn uptake system ZnuABC Zn-binding protein ZnuA
VRSAAILILTVACLLCAGLAAAAVNVAATIFPLASIASEIGGDRVSVTTIIPAGSDPHEFEITPTSARAIEGADLVLLVAKTFDGWAIRDGGSGSAAAHIEFQKIFRDSLVKVGSSINPHFWLDPLYARQMGAVIGRELSRLDPSNRLYYEARTEAFVSRIDSLHVSVKTRLAGSGLKDFVSFHPSWIYFARRYGLVDHCSIERSCDQEASARWIGRVVKTMKQNRIRFILAEEFSNMALARVIAEDTGAEVVVLDPLGGKGRPGRDSYFALIDYDVSRLEEAARQ